MHYYLSLEANFAFKLHTCNVPELLWISHWVLLMGPDTFTIGGNDHPLDGFLLFV